MLVETSIQNCTKTSRWEPRVLRLHKLCLLLALLVALLAAILALSRIAIDGVLQQEAFVYQIHTSIFDDDWAAFSPFSVVSSIIAVMIGLWWGSIDSVLRSLDPYICMSRSPRDMVNGAGLSYTSSYWFWASYKAARKKSWGIAGFTFGTALSQICKLPFML